MWEQFFLDRTDEIEEMYQAFYERRQTDPANLWDINHERDLLREKVEQEEFGVAEFGVAEWKYLNGERYRAQHAKRKGYTFRPRDRNGDYINQEETLEYWNDTYRSQE